MALKLSHRAYVLETGLITLSGQGRNCSTTLRCSGRTWDRNLSGIIDGSVLALGVSSKLIKKFF